MLSEVPYSLLLSQPVVPQGQLGLNLPLLMNLLPPLINEPVERRKQVYNNEHCSRLWYFSNY